MGCGQLLIISFALLVAVNGASISDDSNIDQQGLYSKSDHVIILTQRNFEQNIYGKNYAQLVQFYSSYCGHCRAFAPLFKNLAQEVINWRPAFKLAVIDCFNEANNQLCRDFEIMEFPTLRYVHEYFVKANGNYGDRINNRNNTLESVKERIISKMQSEQQQRRLRMVPSLAIANYATVNDALYDVPKNQFSTFLVFENPSSTVGSELILDTIDYSHITVKRVYENSVSAQQLGVNRFPGLVAVSKDRNAKVITPGIPTKENMLNALNSYLSSKNYIFPNRNVDNEYLIITTEAGKTVRPLSDVIYYSDLEKTLRSTLHTEITRFKRLNSESHQALLKYLQVVRDNFPYQGNERLRSFLQALVVNLEPAVTFTGSDIFKLVQSLENEHNPYRTSGSDYIGCKGSQPQYRGFTCGLWTLFHALTVGAASKPGNEGPKVLQAMHGYVKNFFGCTHCVEHFLAMAARNRLFDVKDNDKAVLWLWISHNEVNLRLAGDVTEDPQYPKIQFPSITQCPDCRQKRGAWNLSAVYQYLLNIYGDGVRGSPMRSGNFLSNLDIGLLSFLYLLSFIILILVIKFFLTKRFYRKRIYKHGWGKV